MRRREWEGRMREMLRRHGLENRFDRLIVERDALRAALNEVHEYQCGCDRPGNPSACVAMPIEEFATLAAAGSEAA